MMTLFPKVFKRIWFRGFLDALKYAIVRFSWVRFISYQVNRLKKQSAYPVENSMFHVDSCTKILKKIREDGFYFPFNLPLESCQPIQKFALETPCYYEPSRQAASGFHVHEREEKERLWGSKIVIAHYHLLENSCAQIDKIANDPAILEIARLFLGCNPKKIDPRLWWSFVCDESVEKRLESRQTVLYHYDLEGFRFIYFSFYILPTDETSGAHIAVRGSHRHKKIKHLFASANQSNDEIQKVYGEDAEVCITGGEGTGFIEDAFCYHKALAPKKRDRLLLQVRYSV